MLLAIDVGNTDTKLGYFDAGGALIGNWRVTTARRRTSDEYGVLFQAFFSSARFDVTGVAGIVVASVVPQVDRMLFEACRKYFAREPLQFTAATQRVIEIRTDRPLELGADLAAAAIGGITLHGAPLIVVNFGTATTYSAISADAAFLGAVIAPGIQISIDALASRTAKLPQIALAAPPSAIGSDTVTALQSGIVFGAVGQTEAIVARLRSEMGVSAKVIATGGLADIVARETAAIDRVEPSLVLQGLRRHYEACR
ncbi:MAG: type III pantothenate kinase [Candidatus Velthaea sp.]